VSGGFRGFRTDENPKSENLGSALPRIKDNKTIRVADEAAPEQYCVQQSIFLGVKAGGKAGEEREGKAGKEKQNRRSNHRIVD